MQKIVNELITSSIKGVDVYRYNNATWLIFTDETRWVAELTDGGTLWYSYRFFNDVMRYVSMDPKEYEGYITQWANDYFLKGVKEMGNSNSIRIQNRAENLAWRIVKTIKPNVVFHGIDKSSMSYVPCSGNVTEIWRIVDEGIKNTYPDQNSGDYDWSDEFEAGKVIYGGVKI